MTQVVVNGESFMTRFTESYIIIFCNNLSPIWIISTTRVNITGYFYRVNDRILDLILFATSRTSERTCLHNNPRCILIIPLIAANKNSHTRYNMT